MYLGGRHGERQRGQLLHLQGARHAHHLRWALLPQGTALCPRALKEVGFPLLYARRRPYFVRFLVAEILANSFASPSRTVDRRRSTSRAWPTRRGPRTSCVPATSASSATPRTSTSPRHATPPSTSSTPPQSAVQTSLIPTIVPSDPPCLLPFPTSSFPAHPHPLPFPSLPSASPTCSPCAPLPSAKLWRCSTCPVSYCPAHLPAGYNEANAPPPPVTTKSGRIITTLHKPPVVHEEVGPQCFHCKHPAPRIRLAKIIERYALTAS